jgi:hypothetical protein
MSPTPASCAIASCGVARSPGPVLQTSTANTAAAIKRLARFKSTRLSSQSCRSLRCLLQGPFFKHTVVRRSNLPLASDLLQRQQLPTRLPCIWRLGFPSTSVASSRTPAAFDLRINHGSSLPAFDSPRDLTHPAEQVLNQIGRAENPLQVLGQTTSARPIATACRPRTTRGKGLHLTVRHGTSRFRR